LEVIVKELSTVELAYFDENWVF